MTVIKLKWLCVLVRLYTNQLISKRISGDIRGKTPGTSFQFFQGGGNILTDFLGVGGAKYEKKTYCVPKHKSHYFSNSGGQMPPPLLPPPNDVPGRRVLSRVLAGPQMASSLLAVPNACVHFMNWFKCHFTI